MSLGFQWYAINLSEFIQVVVAKKESQPAVQAASCAAASRLCRHSAQTHTPYNASVLSRVCTQICATMVGCWLNCASELSAHDACAQRPPAGASARVVSHTPS